MIFLKSMCGVITGESESTTLFHVPMMARAGYCSKKVYSL